jgi:ABC-type phosphate/phosphonate transport system substrate-binding protein
MRAAEKKKVFVFGVNYRQSNQMDAQINSMIKDVLKAIKDKYGIDVEMKWFLSDEELNEQLANGKLDFYYKSLIDLGDINNPNYSMLVRPQTFEINEGSNCIYVKGDSLAYKIDDLRGKSISTGALYWDYIMLREITKQTPEEFFRETIKSHDITSSVYALAMNQADSIYTNNRIIEFLKVTNPGPVKGIRVIGCAQSVPLVPIFYSNNISTDIIKTLRSFFFNIYNEPSMKKYRPLIKMFKLKFVPAVASDYSKSWKRFDIANKAGWYKNYEYWIKTVKVEGK